jgi:hypothetical protein
LDRPSPIEFFLQAASSTTSCEPISQKVKGVRTIEDQLRKALADYPPERGHDLIVVPLPVGVEDKWAFAERSDEHARRCLAKVKRVFR